MTLRWYDVLVNLQEAERPVRMNELASRILASKSGLTRVVDRMEEAGLVERQRPPEDRRAIEVVTRPKGADALEAASLVHRRGIHEHFAQHVDGRAFAALLEILRPVRSGLVTTLTAVHAYDAPSEPPRLPRRPSTAAPLFMPQFREGKIPWSAMM